LWPEKKHEGNQPQPDRGSTAGRDRRDHVEIHDCHNEEQYQVPTSQDALEVCGFGLSGAGHTSYQFPHVVISTEAYAARRQLLSAAIVENPNAADPSTCGTNDNQIGVMIAKIQSRDVIS
jgi:hypothetical protein